MAFSVPKQPAKPQVRSVRARPGVVHNIKVNVNIDMNSGHPLFTGYALQVDPEHSVRRSELGIDVGLSLTYRQVLKGKQQSERVVVESWTTPSKRDSAMDDDSPKVQLMTIQSVGMLSSFNEAITFNVGTPIAPWVPTPENFFYDINGIRYICPPSGCEAGKSIRAAAMAPGGGPGTICCVVGDEFFRRTKIRVRGPAGSMKSVFELMTFMPFTIVSIATDVFTAADVPDRFPQAKDLITSAHPWHRALTMILTHDMKLIEV